MIVCFIAVSAVAEPPEPTKLLFLGNRNIAPVVYLEDHTPSGVAVDIVRALAKHIPEPIEIRAMDWAEAQAMVARGDASALIQINPTEERKKIFEFSDPLLESQFSIFVQASRTGILGISSLRGLRVGVEEGGLPQRVLADNPDIHPTIIPNFVDGFELLSDGAVDAVVVDYLVGSYVLGVNRIPNIKAAGEPIAYSYSAIAVRKGDAKLLGEINNALRIIRADGAYQSIIDKWKPTETIFETREQIERRNYRAAILVLAVGLLIVAIWTVTLKRNIAMRQRVEEQLRRVNRARRAVGMCNQALVHATDEAALVQQVCQIIVEQSGYRLAWVGYAEQDAAKTVRPIAEAGFNEGYVEMANVTWADSERGHGPTGTCIRTGETQTVKNIDTDPRKAPWREEARRRGYASSAAIPLVDAGTPIGALTIYSSEVGAFTDEEVSLLTEFAEDLGYGVASLRTQAERKRAEEALRASEEQWKAVFENNPTMYFMVDPTGAILSVNPFGAEQLGYACDELIGRPVVMLFHEADVESGLQNEADCFEHIGRTKSWELRKVRKNGETLWARETGRAMLIKNRPVVLVVSEDITERKRAEEALREMQTELAHANRVETIGQLAASIAHEVSQPIAAAVTNAQAALRWMNRPAPDLAEVRQSLERIVRDGLRAGAVVDGIRRLIKGTAPHEDRADVNAAVGEVLALVRSEATKNGVSMRTEFAEGLPSVQSDRVELQQVILNLIVNAIEAMSGGEGPRDLLVSAGKIDAGDVLVSVSDSGPGLAPAELEHLFKAFYTTKPSGLGLGLSICRSIVEAHGGKLWASANTPRGAVFQFTLPAHRDPASRS